MAEKKRAAAPQEEFDLYAALVASHDGVDLKGAKMPYTSLNGHMFSLLAEDGTLALRLPKAEREAFLEEHATELCVQYGRVMKEYVVVPPELLADTAALAPYFARSVEYVASLKPKPTKRARKKG